MHDGVLCDPIQGQVKVTRCWKFEILTFSKSISFTS